MSDEDYAEPEDIALARSLVGRTIVAATWHDVDPHAGGGHEVAHLWLDDGRCIRFGAWGHDDWGATIREITPPPPPPCST